MKDNWKRRRKYLYLVTLYFIALPLMAFIFDKSAAQTAILASAGGLTSMVGAYVFGAVWDDKSKSDQE